MIGQPYGRQLCTGRARSSQEPKGGRCFCSGPPWRMLCGVLRRAGVGGGVFRSMAGREVQRAGFPESRRLRSEVMRMRDVFKRALGARLG